MSTAEFGDPNLVPAAAPAPSPDGLLVSPLTVSPPASPEPVAPAPLQPVAPPVAAAPETPAVPVIDMKDVPLGTLIFREGLLTEEQLEEALHDGMHRGKRLGEVLLERGLVSEHDLGRLLAGQKGLRFVQLDAAAVDLAAVQLLPVEKARLHSVLPIGFQDGLPVVAVADPSNDLVVENVRRALNCEPHLVVAPREALHRQIELAYASLPQPASETPAEPAAPAAPTPPVAPVAVEPQPVVPAPVAPPVVQPEPVGEGLWLGSLEPMAVEPVVAAEPVQPPVEQPVPEILYTPAEPVAEVPVVEPPAPAPVQVPEYAVAPEPMPAPEPVFTPEPVPALEPVLKPEPFVPAPAPVLEQAFEQPVAEAEAGWSVVLRLTDGDRIEVGLFRAAEEAKDHAQSVVRQIASDHSWPFFGGRFIRPDAIVSVDLAPAEIDRWLGSSLRHAWASS